MTLRHSAVLAGFLAALYTVATVVAGPSPSGQWVSNVGLTRPSAGAWGGPPGPGTSRSRGVRSDTISIAYPVADIICATVAVMNLLSALKQRGVRLAIDDLGTGYSSLSYLHMGMTTVAEGIEQDDQLVALQGMGCDLGQGFLLARPERPDVVSQLFSDQPAASEG